MNLDSLDFGTYVLRSPERLMLEAMLRRQGRGYDVHPARARVFVDESGEYRLVWLRDVK